MTLNPGVKTNGAVHLDIDECIEIASLGLDGKAPTVERTVADLSDEELLAMFPGPAAEHGPGLEGDLSPCGCQWDPDERRAREWRLRGEGVDVAYTRISHGVDKVGATGQDVILTGKQSGWSYETTPLGRGHPWMCARCHPPVAGLDVETRECPSFITRP